jgi:hypothetical protein
MAKAQQVDDILKMWSWTQLPPCPFALGMPQKICTKKSQTHELLTLCQEKSYTSQVNCSNKGYLIQSDGTTKYLACVSAQV